MANESPLPKNLIILGIVIPLAALLGYLLSTPDDIRSYITVGLVILVLSMPIFLRWHHAILIVTWNISINVFFLPGQPDVWMLLSLISLTLSFTEWLLTKKESFLYVPGLMWSLVALGLVTFLTARLTGGIGIRTLGGDTYGGKRYVLIFVAIIGFFALSFRKIDPSKAKLVVGLFFLSGVTPIVSNLAYFGGPEFYFLYWVFPAGFAASQAVADWSLGALSRLSGFSLAGQGIAAFLLQRYGVRGLLDISKPWRFLGFLGIVFLTLLGGFRSSVVTIGLLVLFLFGIERLYRTRLMLAVVVLLLGAVVLIGPNIRKLPLSIQRSLSILPLDVNPIARYDAEGTTEWRLGIWRFLLPQVPKHLIKPKGFSLDPTELYLLSEGSRRGVYGNDIEAVVASGAYHSGPLTLVLGLGIWGVIAFVWFAAVSLRVLYRNYRYGPPELNTVNAFLLAYFASRLVYFVVVYGHFAEDLFVFTGIVGLSVSVNGGERRKRERAAECAPAIVPQVEPALA